MSPISSAPPIICAKLAGMPAILIGHSLGGAAILAAAGQIPDAKAVVTIAAPSDPAHVTHLFKDKIEDIRTHGKVEVQLAGRPFHIKREFLDDIAEHGLMAHVAKLHKALLVMHSPTDDTVGIDNATNIFLAAKHPKSFVSLSGADHLLSGEARQRLCRRRHRRLGRALCRARRRRTGRRGGRRSRATSWCARPAPASSSRRSRRSASDAGR